MYWSILIILFDVFALARETVGIFYTLFLGCSSTCKLLEVLHLL